MMSKHLPQVSIGMPVYNGEPFIREALDSLLAQTFTDFELIISDNASIDGTEAICREYAAKDERIRYLRQLENLGAIANFKFVLDEAVGEYFMWAAADDVWDRRWIEILLPVVMRYQCVAYGRIATIDGNGLLIPHPANNRGFEYAGPKLLRRMRYFLDPPFRGKPNPIYGLMPKGLLTYEAFSVLETASYGSDMLFLFNLLNKAEIRTVASVFLQKRIHSGCAGGGAPFLAKDTRITLKKLFAFGRGMILAQVNNIKSYSRLSSRVEFVLQVLFIPFALARVVFYSFSWFIIKKNVG